MKKILGLILAILVISTATTLVFAKENENRQDGKSVKAVIKDIEDRAVIKTALKTHLSPVMHGYGIGFTDSSYITAKWQIVGVKTLSMSSIKEIVAKSNSSNWTELKDELNSALQSGTTVSKGRMSIGKMSYLLTNITVSNTSAFANIRTLPDYEACKNANTTAEACEINSALLGNLTLAKKTQAIEDESNAKVWAGTLNFNSTSYTFVSFAYPRSEK